MIISILPTKISIRKQKINKEDFIIYHEEYIIKSYKNNPKYTYEQSIHEYIAYLEFLFEF